MAVARHVVNVNGVERKLEADGDMPLLWALRDHMAAAPGCAAPVPSMPAALPRAAASFGLPTPRA